MGIVLVVEDDDDLRKAICQVLDDEGFRNKGAANGAEALAALEHGERPSLILLDLMMPVMNGWAFRAKQEADSRFSSIPVIIMTAAARLDDAAIAGADLIRKPVRLEDLVERVRTVLGPNEFDAAPKTVRDNAPKQPLDVDDSNSHKV